MSLIYRGQIAQPSMTTETVDTGLTGKFMGRPFPIRKAPQTTQRTAKKLQYRGATY